MGGVGGGVGGGGVGGVGGGEGGGGGVGGVGGGGGDGGVGGVGGGEGGIVPNLLQVLLAKVFSITKALCYIYSEHRPKVRVLNSRHSVFSALASEVD